METAAVGNPKMVQMNTRIGKTLKEQGDAALLQAGYLPSQAVRVLWEYAAAQTSSIQTLRRTLRELEGSADDRSEELDRALTAEYGSRLVEKELAEYGLELQGIASPSSRSGNAKSNLGDADIDDLDLNDLNEQAAWGRLMDRGLA